MEKIITLIKNCSVLIMVLLCLCSPSIAQTTKKTTKHHRHHKHHHSVQHKTTKISKTVPVVKPALSLTASIEERLAAFAHKTVATLHYSVYKFGGTRFDTSRGVYIEDCSDYVNHLLKTVSPHAFSSLVNSSEADKPTSQHYYNFFTGLSDDPSHYWNKVNNVKELQPGDILVFRYTDPDTEQAAGHVMVVMNKPQRSTDAFFVRVADSAPTGHSYDTRPSHVSGIGIGTMLLKVDPKTGEPAAYAWKVGSCWEKNVSFAMARPTDLGSLTSMSKRSS